MSSSSNLAILFSQQDQFKVIIFFRVKEFDGNRCDYSIPNIQCDTINIYLRFKVLFYYEMIKNHKVYTYFSKLIIIP